MQPSTIFPMEISSLPYCTICGSEEQPKRHKTTECERHQGNEISVFAYWGQCRWVTVRCNNWSEATLSVVYSAMLEHLPSEDIEIALYLGEDLLPKDPDARCSDCEVGPGCILLAMPRPQFQKDPRVTPTSAPLYRSETAKAKEYAEKALLQAFFDNEVASNAPSRDVSYGVNLPDPERDFGAQYAGRHWVDLTDSTLALGTLMQDAEPLEAPNPRYSSEIIVHDDDLPMTGTRDSSLTFPSAPSNTPQLPVEKASSLVPENNAVDRKKYSKNTKMTQDTPAKEAHRDGASATTAKPQKNNKEKPAARRSAVESPKVASPTKSAVVGHQNPKQKPKNPKQTHPGSYETAAVAANPAAKILPATKKPQPKGSPIPRTVCVRSCQAVLTDEYLQEFDRFGTVLRVRWVEKVRSMMFFVEFYKESEALGACRSISHADASCWEGCRAEQATNEIHSSSRYDAEWKQGMFHPHQFTADRINGTLKYRNPEATCTKAVEQQPTPKDTKNEVPSATTEDTPAFETPKQQIARHWTQGGGKDGLVFADVLTTVPHEAMPSSFSPALEHHVQVSSVTGGSARFSPGSYSERFEDIFSLGKQRVQAFARTPSEAGAQECQERLLEALKTAQTLSQRSRILVFLVALAVKLRDSKEAVQYGATASDVCPELEDVTADQLRHVLNGYVLVGMLLKELGSSLTSGIAFAVYSNVHRLARAKELSHPLFDRDDPPCFVRRSLFPGVENLSQLCLLGCFALDLF